MGIIGLETALPIAITVLHHHFKLPLWRIVELLSSGPARVFGLEGLGTLAPGAHADVTIFDPAKKWTYDASQSQFQVAQHALRWLEFHRQRGCNHRCRQSGLRRLKSISKRSTAPSHPAYLRH